MIKKTKRHEEKLVEAVTKWYGVIAVWDDGKQDMIVHGERVPNWLLDIIMLEFKGL